jgi:HAD superfamily hydrolase (TIGR01509 family)
VRLAGALFDLDGLLVDSIGAWTTAQRALFESMGGVWSTETKAACMGLRIDEMAAALVHLAGSDRPPAVARAALIADITDLFAAGLPVLPGVPALLDALGAAGVPLAVVSSSYRSLVEAALTAVGRERFVQVVAGDEVTAPKPDPGPYLLAARRLGVEPARCVVFEDSPKGVEAGVAAGCAVVAVPSLLPVAPRAGVSVLPSLADVDVGWLLERAVPPSL